MFRKSLGFTEFALCLALTLTACGKNSASNDTEFDPNAIQGNGDWDRASTLSEAIYNINSINNHSVGLFGFQFSYYDLDHLSEVNFLKQVTLTTRHSELDSPGPFGITLESDTPGFYGELQCLNLSCSRGNVLLGYSGAFGSKLKGSARVDFNRHEIMVFSKKIASDTPSIETEISIARTISEQPLQSGLIEKYRIKGGFINPYKLTLQYPQNRTLVFQGLQAGSRSLITLFEGDAGIRTTAQIYGKVSYPDRSSIEICLDSSHTIRGLGAYGDSLKDPLHLCE